MSSIPLATNVSSLRAQRRLADSTGGTARAASRLSSGLRIVKAMDDAAGAAVSAELDLSARLFNREVQNLNDAIGLLSVADSALLTLGDIATRLGELAAQSANGTFTGAQRGALDREGKALVEEFNRVVRAAQFDGRRLLDGSFDEMSVTAGHTANKFITFSLGRDLARAVGTGEFGAELRLATSAGPGNPTALDVGDLDGDGIGDVAVGGYGAAVDLFFGSPGGTLLGPSTITAPSARATVRIGDVDGDSLNDLVVATDQSLEIFLGTGGGAFAPHQSIAIPTISTHRDLALADFDGDGHIDAAMTVADSGEIALLRGDGAGNFGSLSTVGVISNPETIAAGDFTNDGIPDLVVGRWGGTGNGITFLRGVGDGTFTDRVDLAVGAGEGLALGDVDGDGNLDIVTSNLYIPGDGNGGFGASVVHGTGDNDKVSVADLNDDGHLDLLATEFDTLRVRLGAGGGAFGAASAFAVGNVGSRGPAVGLVDIDGDGVLDALVVNRNSGDLSLLIQKTSLVTALDPLDLTSAASAREGIGEAAEIRERVVAERGSIGATMSRLEVAAAGLWSAGGEYSDAASRIRDVDVADESANLTRSRMLQEAGAAVLAQANQVPALALGLLSPRETPGLERAS